MAHATKDPSQRIVITGMGAATCFGNDIEAFYNRQGPHPAKVLCYDARCYVAEELNPYDWWPVTQQEQRI